MKAAQINSDAGKVDHAGLIAEILELLTTTRAVGFRGMRAVAGSSMSMAHVHVLAWLRTAGDVSVGSLARSLGVSPASATGMIGRMEERGWVRRVHDERDRRVVLVRLAPAGVEVLDQLGARRRESLSRILRRLDNGELVQLRNGLAALHRAVQAAGSTEPGAAADGAEECG